MRPLDRLPTKRTGSRSSKVGPAVTSTRRPASVGRAEQQALGGRRRSRRARPAGPSPPSRRPDSPRPDRRTARRARPASPGSPARPGARSMLVFIAGASSTGARRGQVERRQEVVGEAVRELADDVGRGRRDEQQVRRRWPARCARCRRSGPAPTGCVMTRSRVIASKVSGPTNRRALRVITAATSWPRFCRPRDDLDGLVGADAAGDAERDECHAAPPAGRSRPRQPR